LNNFWHLRIRGNIIGRLILENKFEIHWSSDIKITCEGHSLLLEKAYGRLNA
jgi:hypothetical protein